MKQLLLSILLFLGVSTYAQSDSIIFELNTDSALTNIDFSCSKIIDARNNKENIGVIKNGKKPVYFKGGFTTHLKETIDKLLPANKNKTELVLIIRDFTIMEDIGTQNQYGYCYIEIEFAKYLDTVLYTLGVFNANIAENSTKVKYNHDKRILKTLEKCIKKFNASNSTNNIGDIIKKIPNDTILDYKNCPKKGAYMSYNQMIRNTPLDSVNFEIEKTNKSKYEVYSINTKNPINQKQIQFISDGDNIYMQYNLNQFLKSKTYGKYIFFEGRIPTTYNTSVDNTTAFIVSFSFGVVGGIIFLPSSATSTNNQHKGVVIETETGNLKMVTDMFLYRITKPYPLMLKEYRKSKRKPSDQAKIIIELNKQF